MLSYDENWHRLHLNMKHHFTTDGKEVEAKEKKQKEGTLKTLGYDEAPDWNNEEIRKKTQFTIFNEMTMRGRADSCILGMIRSFRDEGLMD